MLILILNWEVKSIFKVKNCVFEEVKILLWNPRWGWQCAEINFIVQ